MPDKKDVIKAPPVPVEEKDKLKQEKTLKPLPEKPPESEKFLKPVTPTTEAARKVAKPDMFKSIINMLTVRFPELKTKLKKANMEISPTVFITQCVVYSIMASAALALCLFIILAFGLGMKLDPILFVIVIPLLIILLFFYFMKLPDVRMKRRAREVDKELVFAGKQMLIEIRAGVPLFDAMLSISRDYGEASEEFNKIVEKISMGVPADVAMHEVAELNPSRAFNRVIMQLVNSLRSGSDVAEALQNVLDQISAEQIIELKRYGQKLNPIAMFYMLFGIILPSLGVALGIILTSFVNIKIDDTMLWIIAGILGVMQYFFLTMIESARPNFDI